MQTDFKKKSSQYESCPIRKGAYLGHDKNFFLPCEKILSSRLLRTVYHMDPWSCADKEGSKHHSQRCFAGLRGQHAPALPPGCGPGAAVKSVFMAARNGPRADCFPAAGENPGVRWRVVCSMCWTASPLRSGEVCVPGGRPPAHLSSPCADRPVPSFRAQAALCS